MTNEYAQLLNSIKRLVAKKTKIKKDISKVKRKLRRKKKKIIND
jgi:hypothetical protein